MAASISNLWNKWNIRGILILSLSLQIFLILCAPLRKKISNPHIVFLLWLAYLMADWVAAFGIGLVSHSQGNLSTHAAEVDRALQAFWASFLLLHLGGPYTITAFSLEDGSLWRRHLLSLIFQVNVAIYVFVQIFPSDKSLVIPTMLVFLAGVIKNAERTLALYLSSLSGLKTLTLMSNKLRNVAMFKLNEELNVLECEHSNEEKAKLAESIVVKHGYLFFNIFKAFLLDLVYKSCERRVSCKYFHKVCAVDALRVISIELHFMYEVLHTKFLVIRSKWSYIFRFIAFTNVIMAFVLFNRFKKHQLPKLDVVITYILLFIGIALDVITLSILIFSDWTVAQIMSSETRPSKFDSFLHKLISTMDDLRKPRFTTCKPEPNVNATYAVLDTPFVFRRWSESIFACNIFSESWKESPRKMYKHNQCWGINAFSNICSLPFAMTEKTISLFLQIHEKFIGDQLSILLTMPRYTSKNPFMIELWIFIFKEVRRKSKDANNPTEVRKIFEARGDLFIQGIPRATYLLEYVTESTYEASVLSWHIATEICYMQENLTERNDEREFSKILSDYMLYLLLNQTNVMSTVAGFAQINITDIIFFSRLITHDKDVEGLCKAWYNFSPHETLDWPSWPDALRQGIELADEIERLEEKKWEVMSGTRVEMLSYAAGHIKGEAHVQVLSKGGELLAFVWLLMAHLGCFYKPEWATNESYVFGTGSVTELHENNGDQEEVESVETELV